MKIKSKGYFLLGFKQFHTVAWNHKLKHGIMATLCMIIGHFTLQREMSRHSIKFEGWIQKPKGMHCESSSNFMLQHEDFTRGVENKA